MDGTDWSVHELLRELGLNRTYAGYRYLVYILELVRREPDRLEQATKGIYPEVSRAFRVETGRVDSALRTAARVCRPVGREGAPDGQPTVSQFLRRLAREDQRRRAEREKG